MTSKSDPKEKLSLPNSEAVEVLREVYWAGWLNASTWANRDDQLDDRGSEAYKKLEGEAVRPALASLSSTSRLASPKSGGTEDEQPESTEAQRCTCPSGDGSLRWPCPVHPPSAPDANAVGVESEKVQKAINTITWIKQNHGWISDECFETLGSALRQAALAHSSNASESGSVQAQPAADSTSVAVDEAMDRLRRGPDRLWMADLVGQQISVDRMREILTTALAGPSLKNESDQERQGGTSE